MKSSVQHRIKLADRTIDYRVVISNAARKLRVRVGIDGVEVIQPNTRDAEDVAIFLTANGDWVVQQLEHAERIRHLRRPANRRQGEILFRGEPTLVRLETTESLATGNLVRFQNAEIVISRGPRSRTAVFRSLEYWLRHEARRAIVAHLGAICARIGKRPGRIYIMGQRTKWGNCSSRGNLSFSWRLILAPDYVLRYLVTHEAVHLAVPDHSAKFWLTVQSLCRETEKAKQWLSANGRRLHEPISIPGQPSH